MFAGNKSCIRDVAERFDMGKSCFARIIDRVASFLDGIAPKVVALPEQEKEKIATAAAFEKVCFDSCLLPAIPKCLHKSQVSPRI